MGMGTSSAAWGLPNASRRASCSWRSARGVIAGACVIDNADDPTYAVASWRVDVPQPEVGVLHLFVIDPACRRQGIAPVLLEAAAQEARKRGFATLRLDVFDNNEPAVRLYLVHGYEDRGVLYPALRGWCRARGTPHGARSARVGSLLGFSCGMRIYRHILIKYVYEPLSVGRMPWLRILGLLLI